MSRHVLSPHADLARPLQTFFCQVLDLSFPEEDSRREVLWRGCSWQEVLSVDEVIQALAPWAAVPLSLRAALLADQEADRRGSKPPVLTVIEGLCERIHTRS